MKFGLEIYEKMMLSMSNLFLILLLNLLVTCEGKSIPFKRNDLQQTNKVRQLVREQLVVLANWRTVFISKVFFNIESLHSGGNETTAAEEAISPGDDGANFGITLNTSYLTFWSQDCI